MRPLARRRLLFEQAQPEVLALLAAAVMRLVPTVPRRTELSVEVWPPMATFPRRETLGEGAATISGRLRPAPFRSLAGSVVAPAADARRAQPGRFRAAADRN
jgi:hypothetical protein